MSEFVEAATEAAAIMAEQLDLKLQADLQSQEWEHNVEFTATSGKIYLAYAAEQEGGIFNAEYGSEVQPHKSILRPLMRDAESAIHNMAAQAAIEYVFSKGLV